VEVTGASIQLCRGGVIGLLKGFSHTASRLEVEVIVPHRADELPGFGEFVFVQPQPDLVVVGRVCHYQAAGRLVGPEGDAYLADLSRVSEAPPDYVVQRLLRYTLKLQLLGHLRLQNGDFAFSVGERSLATFGSPVRLPSEEALSYLCNVNIATDPSAVVLGHLAYGKEIDEQVPVRFSIERLKGRRSFVFARAGYGKSNLVKYLISQLYSSPPDVGLLIFDPEGEYAFPDASGRPGLADVPELDGRISVYTRRTCPDSYRRCVRGEPYLDFADFYPQDIVSNFVPAEKQEAVFAGLLRSMRIQSWKELVAYVAQEGYKAEDGEIARMLDYRISSRKDQGDVSIAAIRNNLIPPMRRVHRSGASLGRDLIQELRDGRVVIVDTSLLASEDARAVSGMLLFRIFAYNRKHFTDPTGSSVRCLAVIEESQTVLGEREMSDENVFVRWVKEGRKYNLGALLVTQQPGAIADQIISQGDNFFVMHLLNDRDLRTLQRHNGYYTEDLLGVIRSEPIPGNCYFWSAPDQPFVLPIKVCAFDSVCGPPKQPGQATRGAPLEPADWDGALGEAILDVLASDTHVWLYPVNGGADLAFSHDYLVDAVGGRVRRGVLQPQTDDLADWLATELRTAVKRWLRSFGARPGYATLAGVKRPVWAIQAGAIPLRAPKQLQSEAVDVVR
jgi:DNA helicase HerA-like ATPase